MTRSSNSRSLRRVLALARRLNCTEEGRPAPTPAPSAGWSRRHFLQTLAGVTAASALPIANAGASPDRRRAPRIAILGAGLAGLNAAYQLKKNGVASTVYEARQRVGGRVQTVRNAFGQGSITDLGAELVNTNHGDMLELAADFGIGLFDRLEDGEATGLPSTAYLVDGQVLPEATVAQAFRALAKRIGQDAKKLDRDPDRYLSIYDNLSAKSYLDQNADALPAPWVRTLIEQTVRSEYGVEPDRGSSLIFLYNLPVVNGNEVELLSGSDERYLVEGGSGAITDAMAAYLGSSVRTGFACQGIERRRDDYRLTFENGDVVEADLVVCALPLTVLRRLNLDLSLPKKFVRFINEVDLGVNEKVIAGFTSRFWRTRGRFANESWATEAFTSSWDAAQRQPTLAGGALTFFTGGDGANEALKGSASRKAADFVATLGEYYPEAAAAYSKTALRTNWLNDIRCRGAYTNFAPGQTTEFAEFSWYEDLDVPADSQEVRFGDAYFIGEHASSEYYGFMNGAAETGRLAATSILRQLGRA